MRIRTVVAVLVSAVLLSSVSAAAKPRGDERRPIGLPLYTMETAHFRINYQQGLQSSAKRIGCILEELYGTYTKTYNIVLPEKTEVLVSSTEDELDDFASANTNLISIVVNDFGYNMRGSGDYLRDAVAHEFAHIMSITTAQKTPPWLPFMQVGYVSHPNDRNQIDAFHVIPFENLPPWFFEGIAQYESTREGGDTWDTHRDMILRTLALSKKLISWDHMSVFAGRGDDYEKTYNHGFSLVKYIGEKYGYGAIVSILRESAKLPRLTFDRSIKKVLGIPARRLYRDWTTSLEERYRKQVDALGTQVYGRRISKYGWDNNWPRFAPHDSAVYFLSNWRNDYSWGRQKLYSYSLIDTLKEDERSKRVATGAGGGYDIQDSLNLIVYSTSGSTRSNLPYRLGGDRLRDLTYDTLVTSVKGKKAPKPSHAFRKAHKRPITVRQSLFVAAFSPTGNRLAAAQHHGDRFYLCLLDTLGHDLRVVYPTDTSDTANPVQTIYSVDWSHDGHSIAFSYVQRWGDRKIGIYDTLDHSFRTVCDTKFDERDPRFSRDGAYLYFSSDRTGIFNIYRLTIASGKLERMTNVAGGAFYPDVSRDGKRLTYVNYDKDGFGVYLLDSLHALADAPVDSSAAPHVEIKAGDTRTPFTDSQRYSRFPRQLLLVPTVLTEEVVTQRDNVFKGAPTLKVGAVANLFDPFSWLNHGNSLGAYFLIDPSDIFGRFFNDKTIIGFAGVDYDLGVFGESTALPFTIGFQYLQRGVAEEDWIQDGDENDEALYGLTPRQLDLYAGKSFKQLANIPLKVYVVGSYIWYTVYVTVPDLDLNDYHYDAAKGYRLGTYLTYTHKNNDRWASMSPKGYALKLAYDYYDQTLQDEEQYVAADNSVVVSSNRYAYSQITASGKLGLRLPWSNKERLYFDGWATAVELTDQSRDRLMDKGRDGTLTSFYEPVTWLPGYAYYYRDTVRTAHGSDSLVDTILLSGNALAQIHGAYRFPLWPRSLDWKLGFIYFDHLYGAVNGYAAAAWHRPSDALKFDSKDWLTSIGLELRLEAIWFNRYPLDLSLRWDRGLDLPAPLGGNRYSLSIGFDFDDWSQLDFPDTHGSPAAGPGGFVAGMR